MTEHIQIHRVGRCSVQDLGRYAGSSYGFGVGGAADQYAAQCANAAIGNDIDKPLLESTASALAFTVTTEMLICVTGSVATLTVDGVEQPMWEPVIAPDQALVEIGYPRRGAHTYVAFAATMLVPQLMSSVAPDPFIDTKTSPWLSAGDTITVSDVKRLPAYHHFGHPLMRPGIEARTPATQPVVRVIPGPDWFVTGADQGWLFDHEYVVGNDSNAVGTRLSGATAPLTRQGRISRGVPIGAVEMPAADEGLIVLRRSRLLTAGYPVPVVVATVDHDVVGQLMPGDRVGFMAMTREDAVAALAQRTRKIAALLKRSRTILDPTRPDRHSLPSHLLG